MAVTASMVKELRERSGAGMMECKKALVETDGDIEAAIEHLRKSGAAKAAKKAGRIAAEGAIVLAADGDAAVMVEVNSETDFVANDDNFTAFADSVAQAVLKAQPADVDALRELALADGETVEQKRAALVAKIGENIDVRRFTRVPAAGATLESYLHGKRIGVVVALDGGSAELARDVAMHIAASNPVCVSESDVPADLLEKEREIHQAQAAESGKPPEIVEKMVTGRLKKFIAEVTLLGQPFVKDPDKTVAKLLGEHGASVKGFVRYEVGEGIEKKEVNFAEEVAAQARSAGQG
ncbi:MAG: elongation factor Ts [Gammaproteobacteria bacterium]|nr:elongation factor Ts [Gammaproteobacteria bacterium]MCP5202031.1 elongation factor Ts [Gammaproteobacteria bacterium]